MATSQGCINTVPWLAPKSKLGVLIAVTPKVTGARGFLMPSSWRLASWNLFQDFSAKPASKDSLSWPSVPWGCYVELM